MNFDCTIAVFQNFEQAAEAIRQLDQRGVSNSQVSLVLHDVDGELPPGVVLDKSHSRSVVGQGEESVSSDDSHDPLRRLEKLVSSLTGELFSGLLERFRSQENSHRTFEEYQRDVLAGKLLVVVCGKRDEVDDAARWLSDTEALQVNVHYA